MNTFIDIAKLFGSITFLNQSKLLLIHSLDFVGVTNLQKKRKK